MTETSRTWILPQAVRDALKRAAETPVTPDNPLARIEAIERAQDHAYRTYPELFRKDARCPS